MEERNTCKGYLTPVSTKSAADERERMMIEMYNSSRFGAAGARKKYGMEHLRFEDVEDAATDAFLKSCEKADWGKTSAYYSYIAGRNTMIKRSDIIEKEQKVCLSLESISGWSDNEDECEYRELPFASDDWADRTYRDEEENEQRELRSRILAEVMSRLPEKTQVLFKMLSEGDKTYEEIAEVLGCSVAALETRKCNGKAAARRIEKQLRREWAA